MYRRYGGNTPRTTYGRPRSSAGNVGTYPFYSNGRSRPRAFDRDRVFWGPNNINLYCDSDEEEECTSEVVVPVLVTKLHVTAIDLHIPDNAKAHHTDRYECTTDRNRTSDGKEKKAQLVVRRGQAFKITIHFDRPYDIEKNDITLTFNLVKPSEMPPSTSTSNGIQLVILYRCLLNVKSAEISDAACNGVVLNDNGNLRRFYQKSPKILHSTNIGESCRPSKKISTTVKVDESGNTSFQGKCWGAAVTGQKDCSLTLSVFVPASCPIGEWGFSVRTIVDVKDGENLIWQYNHCEEFCVLFNPWCKDDWVYLEHDDWMNEAVLNDSGVMYYGDPMRIGARSWHYGQFDDGILEACLHLIRKGFGFEATPVMGDAAKVSRILTKMVNAPDDGGVVMGNWSGEYEDGTSPTKWVGSVKILQEYMETGKPVKYGQCWVFAGVLTTVCRAVGLPCRNITNFSSAHNTDADHLSVDIINVKDEDGEWTDISGDSIWNFHCWNEVWMRRPDLGSSDIYDGWQVIDATPQEKSADGVYTCGPCPVVAIKEGDITVGSDGAFIFCEVNGDEVERKECEKTGMLLETKRTTDCIGLAISTHLPTGRAYRGDSMRGFLCGGENLERLDVTDEYKYMEGSAKEREIVRKAEMMFRRASAYRNGYGDERDLAPEETVKVEIEQGEDIFVGQGFEFVVRLKNTGASARMVKNLVIKVFYKTYFDAYTGVAGIKKFESIKLGGMEEVAYRIAVDEERATRRPQDGYHFEIKALADFHDSSNIATGKMNFRLRRPDIGIMGPSSCSLHSKIPLEVSFINPLKVTLTNCQMDIEGGFKCIEPAGDKFIIPNIGPGMTWKEKLIVEPKLYPLDKDERNLTVALHCKQLSDVYGHYTVNITSKY